MSNDFKKRFDDLIGFIDNSLADVRAGNLVEMESLEKIVATLCADIEKADAETAKDTQPMMAQMITKLDELAQGLLDFQIGQSDKDQ